MVCAMELGLITKSNASDASFGMLPDNVPIGKTNFNESKRYLCTNPPNFSNDDPLEFDRMGCARTLGSFWSLIDTALAPRHSKNLSQRKRAEKTNRISKSRKANLQNSSHRIASMERRSVIDGTQITAGKNLGKSKKIISKVTRKRGRKPKSMEIFKTSYFNNIANIKNTQQISQILTNNIGIKNVRIVNEINRTKLSPIQQTSVMAQTDSLEPVQHNLDSNSSYETQELNTRVENKKNYLTRKSKKRTSMKRKTKKKRIPKEQHHELCEWRLFTRNTSDKKRTKEISGKQDYELREWESYSESEKNSTKEAREVAEVSGPTVHDTVSEKYLEKFFESNHNDIESKFDESVKKISITRELPCRDYTRTNSKKEEFAKEENIRAEIQCDSLDSGRSSLHISDTWNQKEPGTIVFKVDPCASSEEDDEGEGSVMINNIFLEHSPIYYDSKADDIIIDNMDKTNDDNSYTDLSSINQHSIDCQLVDISETTLYDFSQFETDDSSFAEANNPVNFSNQDCIDDFNNLHETPLATRLHNLRIDLKTEMSAEEDISSIYRRNSDDEKNITLNNFSARSSTSCIQERKTYIKQNNETSVTDKGVTKNETVSKSDKGNNSPEENIIKYPRDKGLSKNFGNDANILDMQKNNKTFHDIRRVTRGLTRINKENFVGKLVWGSCSGWWPALIIDANHVGMISEAGKLWVYWLGESRISLLNEKTKIEPFSSNLESRLSLKSNVDRTRAIETTIQMLRERIDGALIKPYYIWIKKNFPILNNLDEMKFYPYPAKIQKRLDALREKNAKATEKYLLQQKQPPEQTKKQNSEKVKESSAVAIDPERLPLMAQKPGEIAWAKIIGHNWWPAMIIDYRDCCMREPNFGCQWIMWYGDYKLSEIHHRAFLKFEEGLDKMREYILNTTKQLYLVGVLHAVKDYYSRLGYDTDNWTMQDVLGNFPKINKYTNNFTMSENAIKVEDGGCKKYSPVIIEKLKELKMNSDIDDERKDDIESSDAYYAVMNGKLTLEKLCLRCLKQIDTSDTEEHPFFKGSLCKQCSDVYKPRIFVYGNDGKCFYCTVCAGSGTVVMCDSAECPRVYCTACLKYLLCPKTFNDILLEDPWDCFVCNKAKLCSEGLLTTRIDWEDRIIGMFRTNTYQSINTVMDSNFEKRKIRVLSLFDGLSTGLLVLLKLGINVEVYYASEIDKDALLISSSHFGDKVIQLGDVRDITKEKLEKIAPIDLLIGGSPCNDLSLANPARLGLHDPKGTGVLFFEYCRIMKLLKKANKNRHLFWLYENVASMPTEYRLKMNKYLGQEPDVIDSANFSPQHRLRLYWHNLPLDPVTLSFQDKQDVQDILTPHCNRYALVKKIRTVTTKVNSLKQGKAALKPILMKNESDSIWITELEEIFGFPRHYTDVKNLCATKRQRLIGKSWSVQTLSAILRPLCTFFECT